MKSIIVIFFCIMHVMSTPIVCAMNGGEKKSVAAKKRSSVTKKTSSKKMKEVLIEKAKYRFENYDNGYGNATCSYAIPYNNPKYIKSATEKERTYRVVIENLKPDIISYDIKRQPHVPVVAGGSCEAEEIALGYVKPGKTKQIDISITPTGDQSSIVVCIGKFLSGGDGYPSANITIYKVNAI